MKIENLMIKLIHLEMNFLNYQKFQIGGKMENNLFNK